jgi:hypothetical protein
MKSDTLNPTRIVETHTQDGARTIDKRSVEIRRLDGHFEPYLEIEKETVQVDTTTVRATTRTYGRDARGSRILVQVTEEAQRILPSGESRVLRTTSNPDVNGKLQPVQREIVETKTLGPDVEETNTTAMLPSVNGGMAPVLKTHELRRQTANGTVESQKTTLLPDGAGNWQVNERQQTVSSQKANNRSSEERVSRLDAEGKLGEISRVLSTESETPEETRRQVETYSIDVPGTTRDGSLHLVERATTTERTNTTGEHISERRVEQPTNAGDPDSDLRVSILVNGTLHPGPSGSQATRTIRSSDSNGSLEVVSVDTTKSDSVPTIEFQQAPPAQQK